MKPSEQRLNEVRHQRTEAIVVQVTMELDDAYDSDLDEASQEQDAVWFERVPPELEWDESDVSTAVADLVGASRMPRYT